jgi:hypothetical protein
MANATTIILKYGNGEPASGQLVKGEIGVDIAGEKLWTWNGVENIILSGADLDIGDLPAIELPDGNYVTIEILAGMVVQNTTDIAELDVRVTTNEGAIGSNTAQISLLSDRVTALEVWQTDHEVAVGNLIIQLEEIEETANNADTLSQSNKGEIDLIRAELSAIEAGLQYGGNYSAHTDLILSVSAWAVSQGIQAGQPLQNFQDKEGIYFIVTEEGDLNNVSTDINGKFAYKGDWLISDGSQWLLANYAFEETTFANIAGKPLENDELAAEFALYLKKDGDVLEGGTYSNTKSYMQKMADAKK